METIVQTEYQDIYKLKAGVLLKVNKFKYINYSDKNSQKFVTVHYSKAKYRLYDKNCKDLRILEEDYYDPFYGVTILKGTLIYGLPIGLAVESCQNKSEWTYEVNTTGSAFKGTYLDIIQMINELMETIEKENSES